jgi:ketosteroid isomerase-like protein
MNRKSVSILACVAVLAAGLVVSPALAGNDASNMTERIVQWQNMFNAGDAKGIAAMYAEDGARLPYQAPAVSGRAAIAANIQGTLDQGIVKIELALAGSESQGDLAWAHGTYHLMNAEGATVQKGKWMNVSRKVKGTWLTQADIWNTDAPE